MDGLYVERHDQLWRDMGVLKGVVEGGVFVVDGSRCLVAFATGA